MFDFLISSAVAETTTAAATPPPEAGFVQMGLLIAMVVVFYFLLWRPQSKRAKAHKALISNVKAGDEIATTSGIIGIIKVVEDDIIKIQIAKSTVMQIQKTSVSTVYPKGTVTF